MLKLIITITLLLVIFEVSSQSIVVKSFRKTRNIRPENATPQYRDQNSRKFAILKVITTQAGFILDFDSIGKVVSTDQKEGEKWYLVPAGTQRVNISNKQFGVQYNYSFGTELQESAVYVMELYSDKTKITGGQLSETKSIFDQENKENGALLVSGDLQNPEYPGGYKSMLKYLSANAQYPALALEKRIEGTVLVQFTVSAIGKISTIRILRGVGSGCDEEAIRLVNMMPDWSPGRIDGKAVPVAFQIPIKFKLPVLFPFPKSL